MKKVSRIPLTMLSPGTRGVVTELCGGRGVNHRLAEIGISVGTNLMLVNRGGGPVIVEVYGTKLVMGHGMAHRVMVKIPE